MKTLSPELGVLIQDAVSEGLTTLPEGVLEKDQLVTEALDLISRLNDDQLLLTFCGGTCLAKAHGLLERMSEDIDFKLGFTAEAPESATGRRKLLSGFKHRLVETLLGAGFEQVGEVDAKDGNHYISARFAYQSRFPPVASLRSELLIEITANPPRAPLQKKTVRPLIASITGKALGPSVTLNCISPGETMAEKVVSLLRRTAQEMAGQSRGDYDWTLVRHIYDVHRIATSVPEEIATAEGLFPGVVRHDIEQFGSQHPEFGASPREHMERALAHIRGKPYEEQYLRFVDGLVFGDKPTFHRALQDFEATARKLLERI